MVLRNVAKTFSLEEQRQEINEIAVDLDAVNTTLANWNAGNWDTAYSWGDHAQVGYWVDNATSRSNWDTAYGWGDHGTVGYWVEDSVKISNWDTAYGWGDHGAAGYLVATAVSYNNTNWDTAYSWGDHALAGYLTSYTETDPVFGASAASGIAAGDITNWNTAYGWGDHGTAGYAASGDIPSPGGTYSGTGTAQDPIIESIQLNAGSGNFGGDSLLVWNTTNNRLGVGQATPESTLHVDSNEASGYIAEFNQTNASNSAQVLINSPTDDATRPVLIDLSRADNIQWSLGQAYNDSNEAFFISSGVSLSTGITGGTLGILPNGKTTIAYSDGTDSSFGALPSYGQLEIIKIGKDALSNPIDSNWSYLSFHKTGTIAWQQGVVDSSFVVGQTGGAARDDIQSERLRITEHGKFVHTGGHDNNSGGAGLSAGQYNRITASLTVPVSSTRTLTFTGLQSGFATIRGGGYANAGQGAVAFAYQLGGYMTGTSFYDVVTLQQWSNTSTISISKNSGDFQITIGNTSATWELVVNFTVEGSNGGIAVSAS